MCELAGTRMPTDSRGTVRLIFFNAMWGAYTPKQRLHEIENDLIAGQYHSHGSPPAMQFRNTNVARDQREG